MSNTPPPDQTPDGPAYDGRLLARPDEDVVDQGAGFDATTLLTRRRVLGAAGVGAGALVLAACSSGSSTSSGGSGGSSATSDGGTGTSTTTTADGEIPQETNGPYPADGTADLNVLQESGIVRSDVTSSLDGSVVADGVPLEMSFALTDMAGGDVPFAGAAVYMWHCDANGEYSMYSEGLEDVTYLRGVQVADSEGRVAFTTIVPACYSGRWTHIHFEVYPDLDSATDVENAIATSQVAFPEGMLTPIYALDTYAGSTQNLSQVTLETDNVFSDGYELQMGTFTGDVASGYVGSLAVGVDTTTEAGAGSAPGGGGGEGGGPGGEGGPGGGQPPSDGQTPPDSSATE
ncbi:protocatechuate 3,4-dioxygenase beta subunit [Nocardioides zeae]|uniref:Protocatechuate 3,4-dioxygenase beta subunit n=1 Tax=Nocardioides zeae TaxID=1457234 RepID=A0ACC6IKT0_9ACTN|nr:3,4-dioxygenase subunit beta [Nocardioides zeae]MDR6175136.1 protocatechuate 3,4-dioxygenase beta subunit [Nocardioides zeae]MDR6211371.1 protocatechuate 3,4-dioxygenase beta subunit [Nocardioides zeae]